MMRLMMRRTFDQVKASEGSPNLQDHQNGCPRQQNAEDPSRIQQEKPFKDLAGGYFRLNVVPIEETKHTRKHFPVDKGRRPRYMNIRHSDDQVVNYGSDQPCLRSSQDEKNL